MNRNRINSTQSSTRISTEASLLNSVQELPAGSPAQDGSGGQEFHVTYYDSDCGRARTEVFDDAAAAERFANRVVCGEDDWAVVDAIAPKQGRIAA